MRCSDMRIVLVEDNRILANGIAQALAKTGHAVECFVDGAAANEFLAQEGADLAILDINLPSMSGIELLAQIRARGSNLPILLLTANDQTKDRVAGLDAGADDYMVKPFAMEELEARVRALLRRRQSNIDDRLKIGTLEFDASARRIFVNGEEVKIPRKEFALLECLADRVGRLVSKEEIADHMYGVGSDAEGRAVEIYVSRLRKHLSQSDVKIRTARGLGYMLEAGK